LATETLFRIFASAVCKDVQSPACHMRIIKAILAGEREYENTVCLARSQQISEETIARSLQGIG
jgi:hypothetical protein